MMTYLRVQLARLRKDEAGQTLIEYAMLAFLIAIAAIIFLSAMNKEPTHLARAYAAGAVDFVFKPIDALILRSKVAVFVELQKRELARRALEVAPHLVVVIEQRGIVEDEVLPH